jgi:hypothetical protein
MTLVDMLNLQKIDVLKTTYYNPLTYEEVSQEEAIRLAVATGMLITREEVRIENG